MSKKNVHSLGLIWSNSNLANPGLRRLHENVIEGLQPHINVRKLFIRGYRGVTLSPSWLAPLLIPNLVEISLSYCKCEHLGSLRKLPRIKILKLSDMDSLKFIEEEEVVDDASAGGGGGFQSLEELRLGKMANLEGWSSSSSWSSSSQATAEEGFRWLEGLSLEEPMHNLEGSSSSSQVAAAAIKSKSGKKLERCRKLKRGGVPLSLSSLSQKAITQQVPAVFPCLKNLSLYACPKLKGIPLAWSPSWLAALLVPNLVEISLRYCTCEHLGYLRKLPRLKVLKLSCMGSMKFVEEEVVDDASAGGGGFLSLEEISLEEMHSLEGWSSSSSSSSSSGAAAVAITQQVAVFPCLKSVTLFHCPILKEVPLSWSPVQHVDIDGYSCNGMVLGSLRHLPSLPSLRIARFDQLEYFPLGTLTNLTALHKLEISYCDNLKALPVELYSLATLTKLLIWSCPELISLGERGDGLKNLSTLKTLEIFNCRTLKRLPELEKASLLTLRIISCPEMEFSKEDFEHFVALESLRLIDLPKLTYFPEGIKHSAATLQDLQFWLCSKYGAAVDLPDWIGTTLTSVEHLEIDAPENWKVLPQWMQHLTALKRLKIYECDEELIERWKTIDRQREEDYCFNMISHVPDVDLYQ